MLCGLVYGQDLITYKNGTQIKGKVLEITPSMVKFTKVTDGPIYSSSLSEISSIIYENGNSESFGSITAPSKSPNPMPTKAKDNLEDAKANEHYEDRIAIAVSLKYQGNSQLLAGFYDAIENKVIN